MIQLLYTVIFAEVALIMTLLFKTPLRKLVIMTLDRIKRGRGPVVVKTIATTVFVVLLSSVYSILKIQRGSVESGVLSPTDQILMAKHMLEASLMGFVLFLSLMIDRLHHYIRELRLLRKTMETAKKQNRGFEDGKNASAEEVKALGEEVAALKAKIKRLESECETKGKELKSAQAETEALRKQADGFLLEYDRLLEDNQNLRNQLESIDQGPGGKKTM
ncbi:PREDICTED: B-cell receptor-associated protein 31 [Tarenaya hassleriana]|uniref:B-cell receptor-associated protein 31 n=1 Tax=Tarenaya hassleriana TaxID=28532 RepID=UPI00053C525C|nr:PREDICTED: B-cell receptor-associated protein 31 [Tarenaya hassleriana]XP_010549209.1 PREDICTED: B-cell receptor-associated protein 31 [Tarenaya hassleriana]